MADKYAVTSGAWSNTATWSDTDGGAGGATLPADDDAVFILINVAVLMDRDLSAYTGLRTVTIRGHATTPGMLYFKDGTSGYLKIRTAYSLVGATGAAKGRLLANSNGTWGATGSLAFADKAVIDLGATSTIDAQNLDIALYCTNNMAHKYLTTYGVRHTVTGSASANTLTKNSHGLANTTPVMIMSDTTLPAPLVADTVYYVVNTATNTFQLTSVSGGTAIDLTTDGSGTIEVYTGAASSADPVSVFEDVSAESGWTNATGHNRVVIANAGPQNYDQQRLTITTLDTNHIHLSAALDSLQYPGARIYLMARNVSIRSSCTTAVNIVNYANASSSSGVFQCEIWASAGTGTTFYGNGINSGTGHTVSGTISGCSSGINVGTGHTVSGTISGCSIGIYAGTGYTVSGTISGCSSGIYVGTGHTVSGTISGCSSGINVGTGHTVSGTISGCTYGINSGTGHTVSGTISGCTYGINSGTGHTVSGTISGCSSGINVGTGHTVSGTISGCSSAFRFGKTDTPPLTSIVRGVASVPTTFYSRGDPGDQGVYFENYLGVLGASYAILPCGDIVKNTSIVRVGGAASSLEVIPQSTISNYGFVKIFEWVEFAVPTGSVTKTVYIKGEGWSTFPTAAQLYIEAEYLSHASLMTKATVASTDVLTDNTTWTAFDVTFNPLQAGYVRYRGYLKVYGSSCKVYVDNMIG